MITISTVSEYRRALEQVGTLRAKGASAETNKELASLEAAIARYVERAGCPDIDKARPAGPARDPG